jgi:hypothetical protein
MKLIITAQNKKYTLDCPFNMKDNNSLDEQEDMRQFAQAIMLAYSTWLNEKVDGHWLIESL